jgi:NADH:ubiquinone oxidoreductase subunit 2 (subunit N)
MAIGISSEETFLRPLIGSIQNFEIIAIILSIIMMIISIIYLSYKYKKQGKLHGFGIYAFSFIGVYLILMSTNLVYITIGLFFLIISIGLVAHSKR